MLCDELSSLGTTFVGDLLDWAKEEIDVFLLPVDPERADPLQLESALDVPPTKNLLNFQNVEDTLGSWVADALAQADSLFGEEVADSDAPDGSGRDLGVNAFLRQNILDSNRALSVAIADLPFQAFDPVLFKSHDLLTETVITLVGVRILGLDTFSKFDPLTGKCRPFCFRFRSVLLYLILYTAIGFHGIMQRLVSIPCKIHFILIL